jgi:hypothetical protein
MLVVLSRPGIPEAGSAEVTRTPGSFKLTLRTWMAQGPAESMYAVWKMEASRAGAGPGAAVRVDPQPDRHTVPTMADAQTRILGTNLRGSMQARQR